MEVVLQEPALAQRREQDHGKTENPGKTGDVEEPQGVLALLRKWKWRRKLLLSCLRALFRFKYAFSQEKKKKNTTWVPPPPPDP